MPRAVLYLRGMNPRILVILPRIPLPSRDGAEVVMAELLRGFLELGQTVDVFSLNPSRQRKTSDVLWPFCRAHASFEIDTSIRKGQLLKQLVVPNRFRVGKHMLRLSYWLSRFVSLDAINALTMFIEENGPYDVIHCETLFTAAYGLHAQHICPQSTIVYRSHNVEWKIQDRLAQEVGASRLARIVRKRLASQTRTYESIVAKTFDAIACISRLDESWYRQFDSGVTIDTVFPGVVMPNTPLAEIQAPVIGFLGSLDWEPNRTAVEWFIRHVFPLIRRKIPSAEFHIAGRGSEQFAEDSFIPEGVRCIGEVSSLGKFYESVNIVAAPLFSGSGVRIKLLEAFAHSKAVVTTPQGAEGIEGLSIKECVVSSGEVEFATNCVRLLEKRAECQAMGAAARELVQKAYSSQASTLKMLELYKQTLERL